MNKLKTDTQSLQSCVSVSVTDLRIGNYYSYDDDAIKLDGSLLATYLQNDCDLYLYPIPLTEYWIKKLGFFCYGKKRNWFDIDISKAYEMSINTDGKISIGKNGNWTSLNFINKIEYVHQLQNIYHALTGYELQIGSITEH